MTSPPEPGRAEIVGTGLIGGSIGLGLRRQGWHVSGRDTDPERLERARSVGALDAAGTDLGASLVVVATPASSVAGLAAEVLADPARPDELVVTDVSGVKASVVRSVTHPRFIGGHPMAGSEQIGPDGADPELFVGTTWVLTPTAHTDTAAFSLVRGVAGSLGADVVALSPEAHDELVAVVSHVPHLVAATLTDGAARRHDRPALDRLAAGGFRDMTRVAAGHPGIWPDICAENAAAIASALDEVIHDLGQVRAMVGTGDRDGLLTFLERASQARRRLPSRAVRPEELAELRVLVPDRAGVLAEITTTAGDLGVNIFDLEIAHSAERPHGLMVLVIAASEAERLKDAVEGRGHRATVVELA